MVEHYYDKTTNVSNIVSPNQFYRRIHPYIKKCDALCNKCMDNLGFK